MPAYLLLAPPGEALALRGHCCQWRLARGRIQAARPQVFKGTVHAPASTNEGPEPTLRDVFQAVAQSNTTLSSPTDQLGALKEHISPIRHDIQKVSECTTAMETRLGELEDQFASVQRYTHSDNQTIAALMAKADDLENRSRNVGVPEKSKGQNATEYFKSWLLSIFGRDTLTPMFVI